MINKHLIDIKQAESFPKTPGTSHSMNTLILNEPAMINFKKIRCIRTKIDCVVSFPLIRKPCVIITVRNEVAKVMFLQVCGIPVSLAGGIPACLAAGLQGVLSQHALQVVSQHALQQVSRGVPGRGGLLPGGQGGAWSGWRGVSALGGCLVWGVCSGGHKNISMH